MYCSLDDPAVACGWRRRRQGRLAEGDLLILDGRLLNQFEFWLPDGRVRTRNAGSGVWESEPSALYPA